jgi:hypothetical protein
LSAPTDIADITGNAEIQLDLFCIVVAICNQKNTGNQRLEQRRGRNSND